MKSLYDDTEAQVYTHDPIALRAYTSRLLGREPSLVLHGGGNTSVKVRVRNFFGQEEDLLYVKGSGWDLASIEPPGFAPVRMDALLHMASLDRLSDADMVKLQRAAMTDPSAPNPSVEAILHALIPFRYVDHTHADAVVAISNTPDGDKRIRTLYGDRVLIVPYVMPGFVLARAVYEMTRDTNWQRYEGMVLLHHGLFSFADGAKSCYERMISLVTAAEEYLQRYGATHAVAHGEAAEDLPGLAELRRAVSHAAGSAMIARCNISPEAAGFSRLPAVADVATRGPVTPDHIIRTKRAPVIVSGPPREAVECYAEAYREYFARNNDGSQIMLDPAPRWAIRPGYGAVAFGKTVGDADITADITRHTMRVIQWAEALGGWQPLGEHDLFQMEYWELEQAKLKKTASAPPLQGKVALVTGAASGIGRACAELLVRQGAAVIAADLDPRVVELFRSAAAKGQVCDMTDSAAVDRTVDEAVRAFGGLDILISNAGTLPPSGSVDEIDDATWAKSVEVNLTSHLKVLRSACRYLRHGIDPAVVVIASKNVPAPGPGMAAYSAAKAGLAQLARIAALEWGPLGIRVNMIHPNMVFDTGIWTEETLRMRAERYGKSVQEYRTNNVLKVEVTSHDVAAMACAMVGPLFAKTTGAQVPVDGGTERVI